MLARRELSEMQVRQRLARRGCDPTDIESAVIRLRAERALDDRRTAEAMARMSANVKRRGPLRVRREIEHAGIASGTAREAVDRVFEETDAEALLEKALARRLRGRDRIADDREYARLHRFLIAQGFEPDRVSLVLRRLRPMNHKGHKGQEGD